MNTREYYIQCFKAEVPKFVRVLKAVPLDKAAYRPHPRSMSAGDLVWLLASELHDACELVDHGQVAYVQKPAPALAESLSAYEKNAAALKRRLAKVKDAGWKKKARFLMDGKVAWEILARRHAMGLPLRRHPPPRPTLDVPPAHGCEGAFDLRAFGGRPGDVNGRNGWKSRAGL